MRTLFALLALAAGSSVAAQTWTPIAPMGTARVGAASAVLDGRLYVLGGADAGGRPLATAEAFDPATGWSRVAGLREARVDAAAAVLDGRIVLAGGRDDSGEPLDDVEVYDPARDRWESFDGLQTEREGLGVGVLDGRLYAFGGAGERGVFLSSVEAYDTSWESIAGWSLAPPRALFGTAAVGDALVVAGGFSTFGPLDQVDRFPTGVSPLPPLLSARGGLSLAQAPGVLFAVGGRDGADVVRADAEALVLADDAWTPLPPLPQARERAVAAVLDGTLYVVGGSDAFGGVLATGARLDVRAVDGEDGPAGGRLAVRVAGPNPTRAEAVVDVDLPAAGRARLTVVDALGRVVAVPLDADVPAGRRRVAWRADLAPGVYAVRLDALGGRATALLTVVR